jgi:thioredoxin reductase (NADPH)
VSAGGYLKAPACDQTASGAQVRSDVVILNVGVEYRRLAAAGVDELLGARVFYGAAVSEAQAMRGQPRRAR